MPKPIRMFYAFSVPNSVTHLFCFHNAASRGAHSHEATVYCNTTPCTAMLGVNGMGGGVMWGGAEGRGASTMGVIALFARSMHGVGGKRASILVLMSDAGVKRGGVGEANFIFACCGVGVWDSMWAGTKKAESGGGGGQQWEIYPWHNCKHILEVGEKIGASFPEGWLVTM